MIKITDFKELRAAVNKFGIDKFIKTERREFKRVGLDTDLSDVFTTDNGELISVFKDGRIGKVIAHIVDATKGYYANDEAIRENKRPKYHIFECQTMLSMRQNNRNHRYKKAGRTDGRFWLLTVPKPKGDLYELEICGYCRREYGAKYNLEQYINCPINPTDPPYYDDSDMTTVPMEYVRDWHKISRQMKEHCRWTCQQCSVKLAADNLKKYLHTHHIDGNLNNNNNSNLKVLCIKCHSEEYRHGFIKNKADYKEYIEFLESYNKVLRHAS